MAAEDYGVVDHGDIIAGAGCTGLTRLVAVQAGDLEPVLRRVPATAAQLGKEETSGWGVELETGVRQNDMILAREMGYIGKQRAEWWVQDEAMDWVGPNPG